MTPTADPNAPAAVIWAGGYTTLSDAPTSGITALARADDGSLSVAAVAVEAPDPSYLLHDPRDRDVIFAVDEGGQGVQSFRRIDAVTLAPLGWVATGGRYPCHLGFRRSADGAAFLDVSCYGDGVIAVHPISHDGLLGAPIQVLAPGEGSGPHPAQDGPHAHSTLAAGGRVLSADLGTDEVHVHVPRPDGALERVASLRLPAGTGPRDLTLLPSGAVWVLGEHGRSITVLTPGADGFDLGETTSLLPLALAAVESASDAADQAAGLTVTADGSRAYAGLRGSNRIAVLSVGADGFTPLPIGALPTGGDWPRHHLLLDGVLHIAHERSGTVVSLRLDAATDGAATIGTPALVPAPTFLLPA